MGTIFAILISRIAFIFITITSVSMIVVTAIAGSQPPFDPFAEYADIMPGQSRQTVLARGFDCRLSGSPFYKQSCLLSPENSTFSEIWVSIASETGLVNRVVFIPRASAMMLGDLVRLWGKPRIVLYGQTVNFRWRNVHVVAVLQTPRSHFSYWLPMTYVAFEAPN